MRFSSGNTVFILITVEKLAKKYMPPVRAHSDDSVFEITANVPMHGKVKIARANLNNGKNDVSCHPVRVVVFSKNFSSSQMFYGIQTTMEQSYPTGSRRRFTHYCAVTEQSLGNLLKILQDSCACIRQGHNKNYFIGTQDCHTIRILSTGQANRHIA